MNAPNANAGNANVGNANAGNPNIMLETILRVGALEMRMDAIEDKMNNVERMLAIIMQRLGIDHQ